MKVEREYQTAGWSSYLKTFTGCNKVSIEIPTIRGREREREGGRGEGEGEEEREREREGERETKKWPANLGQKIALAQSKLRILQSIARKKMVEASSTIKWAKIPKSLLTLFFFMWQASLFFSPNSYFSAHPYVEGLNVIDNPKCHKVLM